MNWSMNDRGMGGYFPRAVLVAVSLWSPSRSAISRWGWGFHIMRDVVDPGVVSFYVAGILQLYMYRGFEVQG